MCAKLRLFRRNTSALSNQFSRECVSEGKWANELTRATLISYQQPPLLPPMQPQQAQLQQQILSKQKKQRKTQCFKREGGNIQQLFFSYFSIFPSAYHVKFEKLRGWNTSFPSRSIFTPVQSYNREAARKRELRSARKREDVFKIKSDITEEKGQDFFAAFLFPKRDFL